MALEDDGELVKFVRKAALLNAVKHGGKAEAGPVIGKVLGEKPELRAKPEETAKLVDKIIHEVNSFSPEEQQRVVAEKWPETLAREKIEETKQLPPLPNVDRYAMVVTRYAPNPDCVLHLGSARAIVLCYEYAEMYKGKFILRFEDTDPKTKRPVLEFYERIREDLSWLKSKPDEEYIQSDRIPVYYEYGEKLLKDGNAYVCECKPEDSKEQILAKKPCGCRDLLPEKHLARWKSMLEGDYKEGEVVVRVKTDLSHPNPAVRDWPAFRVLNIEKYPHPRVGTKYRVWPLYNLASGVDDHLMGVTHIIRGKEHLTNQVRQEFMYKHLDWKYPEAIHYGRLKITGASLSKSKIVQGVREGIYSDWDDPRLATFLALRRRGILPEAVKKMIVDIGPKTADVTLSWENLYAFNRKALDLMAARYFFVPSPIEMKVKHLPKVFVSSLRLHPQQTERGSRQYTVAPKGADNSAVLWVSAKDVNTSSVGNVIRLMELFNVTIEAADLYSATASFESESYDDARKIKAQLIHWILVGEDTPCGVVMPDATTTEGIAESACKKLKPDSIIQFERFGFVRVDENNNKLIVYYAHK